MSLLNNIIGVLNNPLNKYCTFHYLANLGRMLRARSWPLDNFSDCIGDFDGVS